MYPLEVELASASVYLRLLTLYMTIESYALQSANYNLDQSSVLYEQDTMCLREGQHASRTW